MQSTLATLRDIEGVLGSFLIDESGQLMARDMPGVFDDATLSSASLRLSRLRGALESDTPSFNGCVARFGDHLLVVRPVANRLLCVLVPRGANLTALQMGTNLVSRRIANSVTPAAPPAPSSTSLPDPAPSAALPTPTATLPRPSLPELERGRPSIPPPSPSVMPAPVEASGSGLTLVAALSAAPPASTAPDAAPLVDPHPTRPLPKRFFRGRPVP